jgi:hypothetical protein
MYLHFQEVYPDVPDKYLNDHDLSMDAQDVNLDLRAVYVDTEDVIRSCKFTRIPCR